MTAPDGAALRIGLTGGIGSGKSTVAGFFAALGIPVIDTDAIAHELTASGQPATREIAKAFGSDVCDAQGALNRAALRERVFRDHEARRQLEGILHPLIRREVERRLVGLRAPYVVIVVPLLIESGFTRLVDRILVVDAREEDQIRRVAARNGLGEAAIRRILDAQLTRQERLARADDVIVNDTDLAHLEREVRRLDIRYRELASTRRPGPPIPD